MRMALIFQLEGNIFTSDFRPVFLSFLKKAFFSLPDKELYKRYFKGNEPRSFCFSVKFPKKSHFTQEKIILSDQQLTVYITTNNKLDGLIFLETLKKQLFIKFKVPYRNAITLVSASICNSAQILGSRAIFRTYGFCVREHFPKEVEKENGVSDKYYTYDDQDFDINLNRVLREQAKHGGFRVEIADSIKFTALNCKTVIYFHYGFSIKGISGTFLLEGNPLFMQYLYDTGFGSRSTYFGYLNLIEQDS